MLLRDLFEANTYEPQVLVVYPGRFQPFHRGHKDVYDKLRQQFGNNVFIATSDKTDQERSPFSFADKQIMARAAGIPSDAVVQVRNPYSVPEITQRFDPKHTILVFAVGAKDMDKDPRFSFKPKKDGSPSYLQPWEGKDKAQTMDAHGYVETAPTMQFKLLGRTATSATDIRDAYRKADDANRDIILRQLYDNPSSELRDLFDARLGRGD